MLDVHPGLLYGLGSSLLLGLAFAARPGVTSSRRALACALVLLVPVAGVVLAALVRRVRGGAIELEPADAHPVGRLSVGDVRRLADAPPVLDRLLTGDSAERLEALVGLSSAGDAAAVGVLRWALEHGPSDVVLDAALTLEEIELRGEARAAAMCESLGTSKDVELALAAAQASTRCVTNWLADPAVAPALAAQARARYRLALTWAPERAAEIEEQLARLELAVGRPHVALEIVERLMSRETAAPTARVDALEALVQLRDDAAFAARDFEALSYVPQALEVPSDLIAARRLQNVRA